jgi:predicted TIM-barrel fold metal-dependent hydrolase
VGWIPSVLSLADWTADVNRYDDPVESARPLPTELFRDQVYGCFIDEPIRPKLLDELGVDKIMIETDFPHTATNWPNSMERVDACMRGIPDDARRKILRDNAEQVFDFVAAEPPLLVV